MRNVIILSLSIVLGAFAAAADRHLPPAGSAGRSVTYANQGMVATSHPFAAQIGLDILKRGGTAVDAAIATSAAIGLLEPMSCGIGGDLFAIVWDAKSQQIHGLHANGRMPYAATPELFAQRGLKSIPETGPLSWSVPGCVDGWFELHAKYGKLSMKEILAPSIHYAEVGAPVPEVIAGYYRAAERSLQRGRGTAEVYLVNGRAPRVGEMFKNPALGKTYAILAEQGKASFYQGEIAKRLLAFSARHGGLLREKDLATHRSQWIKPVSTRYRGYDVWELPPPGQGIAALQMLNLLEPFDLKKWGPNSPDYWHHWIEAKKLAYADRAKFYTDPEFQSVPVERLISKAYAEERRKLIDPFRASQDVSAGDAMLGKADTIYLCVVDKDRNCVSLIQSNYFGFGSMCAVPDLGFALQNRGCLFSLDPTHANRLEPGKRPFHTIIPAMVTQNDRPRFVFGVMGGDMQPQGHVQVLVNMIDFGMNVQAAGEAPRMEHIKSATPTGKPAEGGGIVRVEPSVPEMVIAELQKRGHRIEKVTRNGGGYQGIWIDPTTGVLHGGTEARKDGAAVGY